MHSFFIIGSGSVLKSTIDEILKNKGVIKTIYVDNTRDEKRYSKVYRTKDIICLDDDSGFLANSIDAFTWLISADNKKIINEPILSLFNGRALNFHPGILPEYTGLYCYQYAVFNGENEFASTIHFMHPEVDRGDIVVEKRFPIENVDTGLSIYQKSLKFGALAIQEILSKIISNFDLPRQPQKNGIRNTYTRAKPYKIEINWDQSSDVIMNSIRASNFYPLRPPAFQMCFEGSPVHKAVCLKDKTDKQAGTVLNFDEGKIRVASGDQYLIEITLDGCAAPDRKRGGKDYDWR